MLDKIAQPQAMRQVPGTIPIHHRYTLGVAGDRFFRALRDEARILAAPCAHCDTALLPPKMYCERCFQETGDHWIEITGPGRVATYTILHQDLDGQPLTPPQIVALIQWPGIRGGLLHRLGDTTPDAVRTGIPVQPVWAAQRTGALTDISHFRPSPDS